MTSKNKKKILISFWIEPEILQLYDDFAKKARIPRSQLIHNIIETGYEEMKVQNNIGLIKVNMFLGHIKSKLPAMFNEAKAKHIVLDEDSLKKENVSVRLDPDLIQKIDLLSKKINLTRKGFIEYILDTGIREHKILTSIPGFIETIVHLRDFLDVVKKGWKNAYKESEEFIDTKKLDLENKEENSDK